MTRLLPAALVLALAATAATAAAQPAADLRPARSVGLSVSYGAGTHGEAGRIAFHRSSGRVVRTLRLVVTGPEELGRRERGAAELSAGAGVRLVEAGPFALAATAGVGLAGAGEDDVEPGWLNLPDLTLDVVLPVEAEATLRLTGPLHLTASAHRSFRSGLMDVNGPESDDLPLGQWSAVVGVRLQGGR